MTYLYIETDGEVYLVKKGEKLTLSTDGDELPFEIKKGFVNKFPEGEVVYCKPVLDKHPNWTHKDEIPVMDNVSVIAKRAVNFSLARVGAILIVTNNEGKILMTKNSYGYYKGTWKLPGGYLDFNEHPEKLMIREMKEEFDAEIEMGKLISVYTDVAQYPLHFGVVFIYEAKLKSEVKINSDEIAEIAWMNLNEAIEASVTAFNKFGLKEFKKQLQ
jgi:8-oxo-dGTP diphosphatase